MSLIICDCSANFNCEQPISACLSGLEVYVSTQPSLSLQTAKEFRLSTRMQADIHTIQTQWLTH